MNFAEQTEFEDLNQRLADALEREKILTTTIGDLRLEINNLREGLFAIRSFLVPPSWSSQPERYVYDLAGDTLGLVRKT